MADRIKPPHQHNEPVLAEEWFAFKNHGWHTPMAGGSQRLIIVGEVVLIVIAVLPFVATQVVGALIALVLCHWLFSEKPV